MYTRYNPPMKPPQKKPGRPPGRNPARKNAHVQFRIAPDLAAKIAALAESDGITPADWWRLAAAEKIFAAIKK